MLRSELIASKDGLTTHELCRCYRNFFQKELGSHREVEAWLYERTELCRRHPTKDVWLAVQNEDTAHVQKLVGKQKPVKRKTGSVQTSTSQARSSSTQAMKEAEQRRTTRSTATNSFDEYSSYTPRGERTIMTRSQNTFGRNNKSTTSSSFSRSIKKVNEKYEDYNDLPNSNWESNSMQSYSPCDDQGVTDNELDSEHFGSKRSVSVRGKKLVPHRTVRDSSPKGINTSSSNNGATNGRSGFGRGNGQVNVSDQQKCQLGNNRQRQQQHQQMSSSFGTSDESEEDQSVYQPKSPLSPVLRKRRDQQKQQMLNSEKSASLAGSRPNSSINRQSNKTASRSHVKKVLVDAIESAGGEMLLEKLLEIFNQEFMIKRLGKHPVPLAKLSQLIENLKSDQLIIDGDVVMLRTTERSSLIEHNETAEAAGGDNAVVVYDCSTQTDESLFQGMKSDEKYNSLLERIEKLENTLLSKQSMMFDHLLTVANELVDAFQTNMNGKSGLYHKNNNNTETAVSKL